MKKIQIVLILLLTFQSVFSQSKVINASHDAFRYVGRCEFSNPGELSFDWSGVYIQFNFRGKECAVRMSDTGHNYYNVFIDDLPAKVIDVKSDTTIVLASGLGTHIHRARIYKRTEGSQGIATFKGIVLPENGEILAPKDLPTRKIEFIGNSITCGYGTEGMSAAERWNPSTENNYMSYAAILSRAFKADYHIIAHSGQGVVRNYGYKEKTSPKAMPDRYNRVFDEKELPLWNFKKWKPDVVVINLGTNDFSTQPHPDKTVFTAGYEKLIREVQKQYGDLPIFCLVGPMTDEPCYSYVKEMVDELRNVYQKKNIYFVGIPTYLMNPETDLGSDAHPNYSGQKKMVGHVLPVISSILKWNFDKTEL